MLKDPASIALAAFFSFLGVLISIYQILCHLRHYTEPLFQRYIIRIIFMVPVYAIGSFCSLQWRHGAIYFDTLRDCYEAWIIYNFSALLLAYVGGPGAVVVKAEGKIVHPSWSHMTCCLPAMPVDGFFLRRCKQGTVQFVLLKPVLAALTLLLYAAGAYTDGDMSPTDGYFYISILYNLCYTFALYGLILFWIGASELLRPFNPLLKFVLVKTVVFLTFWQGIGISAINSMGRISDPEDGKALQNFMICAEMAIAGVALLYAFPHREYRIGGSAAAFRLDAVAHAASVRDVVADAIHVFAPSYSDYVLYSDGGPADNVKRKKFRGVKGAGGNHPKAGRPMTQVQAHSTDADGRRSNTPQGGEKVLAANRNQAILLDSDSDAMDSEDEGSMVGDTDSDESDGAVMTEGRDRWSLSAVDEDSRPPAAASAAGSRSARPTGTVPPAAASAAALEGLAAATGGEAATTAEAAKKALAARRSSSRRMRRAAAGGGDGGEAASRRGTPGLIKAGYPASAASSSCSASDMAAAAAAIAAAGPHVDALLRLPAPWRYFGAILSDVEDEAAGSPPAAAAAAALAAVQAAASLTATATKTAAAAAATTASASAPSGAAAAATAPALMSAVLLPGPLSRGKATAVRQVMAGVAQAAGRAIAAAQTAAAAAARQDGRQPGIAAAGVAPTLLPSRSPDPVAPPNPIVLPSPRSMFGHRSPSPAELGGGGSSSCASPTAAACEPAFAGAPAASGTAAAAAAALPRAADMPELQARQQQQQQQQQQQRGDEEDAQWARWSNVAL